MKPISLALILWLILGGHALASSVDELLTSAERALQRGDKKEALVLADKAVETEPRNSRCYLARAQIRDARREWKEAIEDDGRAIALDPKSIAAYQRRGEDQFRLGRFAESVADFDKVIELKPSEAPYHWQRGISLYYAGEFERGAKQFELHRTVNADDVENAVWHYLCVARLRGVEKARLALIPIQGDSRVPMMQVYALFAGKATADDVLHAAEAGDASAAERKRRRFYAHLYIGLFQEAAGQDKEGRRHILRAAKKFAGDDYMGDVARVHPSGDKPEQNE